MCIFAALTLALYQEHIDQNLMNFRGGDIEAIQKEAAARGLRFTKPATRHRFLAATCSSQPTSSFS